MTIFKTAIIAILLSCSLCSQGQNVRFDTVGKISKCPIDTIKGIIYFQSTLQTSSTITEGYYIAACGGYQIGRFYDNSAPTFIPAYFIRNDELVNGKRQVNTYKKQKNSGYFTDEKFKKIPFEAVYGLLVIKEEKAL